MDGKTQELLRDAENIADASINNAERTFADEAEAERFFDHVKRKMLNISEWGEKSSVSGYAMFDAAGNEITDREIGVGNFVRISVYGGGKYDWVRVTHIHETPNEFVITVKPSYDPTEQPPNPDVISHFFEPLATNNFCLQRTGETLSFYVIGINERQNTSFTSGLLETARNVAAANLGYYLGLQKAMWTEFCSNMLELEES
jgi:hypothetical protein